MDNQTERNIENEMETVVIQGFKELRIKLLYRGNPINDYIYHHGNLI